MYKKSEIGNARFAVLSKTNMLEYACEVYKEVHQTEDVPKGLCAKSSVICRIESPHPWNQGKAR